MTWSPLVLKPSLRLKVQSLLEPDLTIEFFWDFDDINKEVIMMLAYDWPAFFGFGFGKSMSHADLWVFEIEGQQIKATDHIASK